MVTRGGGAASQEKATCSPSGPEAAEAALHPSSPFLAFLMANLPILVIQ